MQGQGSYDNFFQHPIEDFVVKTDRPSNQFVGVEIETILVHERSRQFVFPDAYRSFLLYMGRENPIMTHWFFTFPEVLLTEDRFVNYSEQCPKPLLWKPNIVVFNIDEDTVLDFFYVENGVPDPLCFRTDYFQSVVSFKQTFTELVSLQFAQALRRQFRR